jgi:predicted nucleotidyltransferase component of viral defense system
MENYKTIAIFTYPSEYTVLKHLLQQRNIRFVFLNETMISILPFHSNAIGGIRLNVYKEDVIVAKEIIDNLKYPSRMNIV